jgi:hypothetical protein
MALQSSRRDSNRLAAARLSLREAGDEISKRIHSGY